jgi:hypothetical protein
MEYDVHIQYMHLHTSSRSLFRLSGLPPTNDHGSLLIGYDVAEYNIVERPLGVGFEFIVIE